MMYISAMVMPYSTKTRYTALSATAIWISLGLQFYLFMVWTQDHQLGVLNGIGYYLSYFTNLSNLIAGTVLLAALMKPAATPAESPNIRQITGAAVFICMAGIIFNLEIRQSMPPGKLIYITNVMLHDVNPLLFLAYWWFYIPHGQLKARDAVAWSVFPIFYFAYILLRGIFTGHYPYQFINAAKLGYFPVAISGLQMLAGFLTLGLMFVALDTLKPWIAPRYPNDLESD